MQIIEDKQRIFRTKVFPYFGKVWRRATVNRNILQKNLLYLSGFSSMDEFLTRLAPKTCAIFITAGIGSRWQSSVKDKRNKTLVKLYQVNKNKPRSLVKIPNFLPGISTDKIALGAYNAYAVGRAASKLIIIHADKQQENIENEIISPLHLSGKTEYARQFFYSEANKPSGHADALIQLLNNTRNQNAARIFKSSTFTIICFGGIPSRRTTVELSLLAMYVLDMYKVHVSWLSPTTVLKNSRYPFEIDKNGIITKIGHGKLFGNDSLRKFPTFAPNNIGIHIFKTKDIIPILNSFYEQFMVTKNYKEVLHGSQQDEFALDHIMDYLIKRQKLFILNTADNKEIQNEVKRIETISKFIKDVKQMFISDFKSKLMTKSEVMKHINHISKCLRNNSHNIVLLDPDPLTRGTGAGHSRQIYLMRLFLQKCKADNLITYISLSEVKVAGFFTKITVSIYKYLQAYPKFYDLVHFLLKLVGNNKIIDRELAKTDMTAEVIQNLKKSANFNSKRPTIFITTHVLETVTAIRLINDHELKAKVLEYIPDPFPRVHLQMMSTPITSPNHLSIVHDRQTAQNLKSIRRFKDGDSKVYPLGTLSNYTFLIGKKEKSKFNSPLHIGIEFGGNYLFNYDKKVFAFIRSIAEKIRFGQVRLSIHTMYHRKTHENLLSLLQELGLNYGIDKNIRIIHSGSTVNPAREAIETREAYLTGKLDKGWPMPRAVISKGSEVAIEHRGDMLIVAIYGAGHERIDAQTGVRENRTINCIDMPIERLWGEIINNLEVRSSQIVHPPQSLAVFGILALLDLNYFRKFILIKLT